MDRGTHLRLETCGVGLPAIWLFQPLPSLLSSLFPLLFQTSILNFRHTSGLIALPHSIPVLISCSCSYCL